MFAPLPHRRRTFDSGIPRVHLQDHGRTGQAGVPHEAGCPHQRACAATHVARRQVLPWVWPTNRRAPPKVRAWLHHLPGHLGPQSGHCQEGCVQPRPPACLVLGHRASREAAHSVRVGSDDVATVPIVTPRKCAWQQRCHPQRLALAQRCGWCWSLDYTTELPAFRHNRRIRVAVCPLLRRPPVWLSLHDCILLLS